MVHHFFSFSRSVFSEIVLSVVFPSRVEEAVSVVKLSGIISNFNIQFFNLRQHYSLTRYSFRSTSLWFKLILRGKLEFLKKCYAFLFGEHFKAIWWNFWILNRHRHKRWRSCGKAPDYYQCSRNGICIAFVQRPSIVTICPNHHLIQYLNIWCRNWSTRLVWQRTLIIGSQKPNLLSAIGLRNSVFAIITNQDNPVCTISWFQ
jgi:hypothetical protein